MAGTGHQTLAIRIVAGCCALLVLAASGCANPTTAYHRQFEYLRRVGDEALAAGRLEEAREHLRGAADLAPIAAASELEFIEALTRLAQASRQLGRLSEARDHVRVASRVFARYRLVDGSGRSLRRIGGEYLLERARVEVALGDLAAGEAALEEFFRLRGETGGDARDSTEAHWLRGELWLVRDRMGDAKAEFARARESARALDEPADVILVGHVLYRVAEMEIVSGRRAAAAALIRATRPDGVVPPALRPGMLLVQARIDVSEGSRDRAAIRLAESLVLLESNEAEFAEDVAVSARAILVASLVFDTAKAGRKLADVVTRGLDLAAGASTLGAVHAGGRAATVGRELFDAGARDAGLEIMDRGRQRMAEGLRGHDHEVLVRVDFALASALADAGRMTAAASRCEILIEASERLADPVRLGLPARLLACGQIHARSGDPAQARKVFGRALSLRADAPLEPQLRMELLLRMGALAHQQKRESEEDKLFERVLVLVMPGSYERVSELLVEAYGSLGWLAPSSAAARLAHVAARLPAYTAEASPLHAIAEDLGDRAPPASP